MNGSRRIVGGSEDDRGSEGNRESKDDHGRGTTITEDTADPLLGGEFRGRGKRHAKQHENVERAKEAANIRRGRGFDIF